MRPRPLSEPRPTVTAHPGCFEHLGGWLPEQDADRLLQALTDQVGWEQKRNRRGLQPRLTAWFGQGTYCYSGTQNRSQPWPADLYDLLVRLEQATRARYNSCLANLYRDGNDSVAWHSDDEAPLGPRPTIASLSLGATRDFNIKGKDGSGLISLPLSHRDLLVMRAESQSLWQHSVPKRPAVTQQRINLTFRWFQA